MAQSVVMYSTEGGKYPVEEYITKLAKKHKEAELAAIRLYVKRLGKYGLEVNKYHSNTIKLLRDGIMSFGQMQQGYSSFVLPRIQWYCCMPLKRKDGVFLRGRLNWQSRRKMIF